MFVEFVLFYIMNLLINYNYNPLSLPLQYWVDYYLQWNQSDYPGVSNVRFPDHQIWKPDILLYNR